MTGPEINGTLRRPWRYSLLTTISDDEGDYDLDVWNRLTEKVARMVVEAQAEAWSARVKADDLGWVSSNPYTNALERMGESEGRYVDLPEGGVRTSVEAAAEWRKRALTAEGGAKKAWDEATKAYGADVTHYRERAEKAETELGERANQKADGWDEGWAARGDHITAIQRVFLGREAAELDPDLRTTNPYRAEETP